MAETMDPNLTNKKVSVCAVCKHALVWRVGPYRLACEVPGCLDLTMPFDITNISVEDLMNRLQKSIWEHQKICRPDCKLGQKNVTIMTV